MHFLSLQNGFVGFVKSTNKRDIKIQPLHTVTFSGLVRKEKDIETAVTENTETASKQNRSVSAGSSSGFTRTKSMCSSVYLL